MSSPTSLMTVCATITSTPSMRVTGDALQFLGKMEVRIILVLFLPLFPGQFFFTWRRDGIGKSAQVLLQFLVAFRNSSLVGFIHLHFFLQHKDQFLAPVALQAFSNLCTAGLNPWVTEFCELPRVVFPADDGPHDQLSSHSAQIADHICHVVRDARIVAPSLVVAQATSCATIALMASVALCRSSRETALLLSATQSG
jgi:hypothetical protein